MWYKKAQNKKNLNIKLPEYVYQILSDIQAVGGRALIIGGAVRDALLGAKSKDIDFEVYNVSYEKLSEILKKYGKADLVGESFGVIKFVGPDKQDFDFSLPRLDNKTGVGHKDFDVTVSSDLTPEEAARRRDFTINCFSGDTKIITKIGPQKIKNLSGKIVEILNKDGVWVYAPIIECGTQKLYKVTLQRNTNKVEILATPNHRWFVRNNHTGEYTSIIETQNLKSCHRIPSIYPQKKYEDNLEYNAVCRGFVFGDGSITKGSKNDKSHANFCGEKDKHLLPFFEQLKSQCVVKHYNKISRLNGLPLEWKTETPILTMNSTYLFSWLAGYFAADGQVTPQGTPLITSVNLNYIKFVELLCLHIGIGTYKIRSFKSSSSYKPESIFYNLAFVRDTLTPNFFIIPEHKKRFNKCTRKSRCNWKVHSIEMSNKKETVYCAFVEDTHSFVLENNILTSNSISYDPLSKTIVDPYHGEEDLNNRILRHTSEAFAEDPLRVLRGMQFVTRFPDFKVAPETIQMMRQMPEDYKNQRPQMMADYLNGGRDEMVAKYQAGRLAKVQKFLAENPEATEQQANKRFPDETLKRYPLDPEAMFPKTLYESLPKERVEGEFNKLVTKGKKPGNALGYLYDSGWSENFPEIHNIKDVPQNPKWHPEGHVDLHTAHVMNVAAAIADQKQLTPEEREILVYSALAHDFAKAHTTKQRPDKEGNLQWTAYGHEEQSVPLAANFLKSIGVQQNIIDKVLPLVANHMQHINYNNTDAFVRKLADKLHPANIEQLMDLVTSDNGGRPAPGEDIKTVMPAHARQLLEHAQKEGIHQKKMSPYLKGEDILPIFGNQPGKHIGDALKSLYQEQLKGKVNNREQAFEHIRNTPFAKQYKNQTLVINGNDIAEILGYKGPEISSLLNLVWEQQTLGNINNRDEALSWLRQYLGK